MNTATKQKIAVTLRKAGFTAQKGMLSGYQQNAVGNEIYISYFTLTASQVAPALMSIRSVLLSAGYAVKFRNQYEGDQTLSVQITN